MNRLTLADRVVLVYNTAILALVLISASKLATWWLYATLHTALYPAIFWLARRDRGDRRSAVGFLHLWYPVLALMWWYPEAGTLRHLIVAQDLDQLVQAWDDWLFPGRLYLELPPRLGPLGLELAHAVYFSYYLLLFVPGLLAQDRVGEELEEYLFVLSLCMLVHYVGSILFPVSGPTALRTEIVPPGGLFVGLENRLYVGFDRGGLAFPSTHAAASVVAGYYAGRFFPRLRWAFGALVAGILAATVLCVFHYPIDTVVGALTGAGFLWLGRWLYRRAASRRSGS